MKWLTGACLMVCGLTLLPACSDDNNEVIAPVFPEKVEAISLASAGEKATFSFTANTDWTLTSSRLWCKFVSAEENVPMLLGTAGEQTVEVIVTDDIWDFTDATAEISLNMGGQSKVVAKVTRGAKGYQITVYGATEEEIFSQENPFVMKYGATTADNQNPLNVYANFDWHLNENEIPAWMNMPDTIWQNEANKVARMVPLVKHKNRVKAQSGELKFYNANNDLQYTLYVNYGGMPADVVEFADEKARWNWIFSADGTEHWHDNDGDMGGEAPEHQIGPIEFSFDINTAYEVLHFEKDPELGFQYVKDPSILWYSIEDKSAQENYKMAVSVDEANPETYAREAVVMVVPTAVTDTIKGGKEKGFLEPEEGEGSPMMIKYEYETRYAALAFSQQMNQVETGAFVVSCGDEILKTEPFVDLGEEELIQMFGTKEVYKCTLASGKAYDPLQIKQNKSPWSFMVLPVMASDMETITAWAGTNWETVSSDGMSAIITGITPESGSDYSMMILTFFDMNTFNPNGALILMRE